MNNYYRTLSILKKVALIFLLSVSGYLQAQVYVNAAASGSGDGSSWANAYTDLQTALDNNTSGEIWIAAGTYVSGGDSDDYDATFDVSGNVALYGGFAGTESSPDDRDIAANPTVLTGDTAEDDTEGNFETNKEDNRRHVVVVDTAATDLTVVFDGLTVQGGHTEADTDLMLFAVAGGGIFSRNTVEVRNCTFRNNYAARGASIFVYENGDNSEFINSTFSFNRATAQSAGVAIRNASNVNVEGCTFNDNATTRGALYPLFCDNVNVTDCIFDNNANIAEDAFGGAMFNWHSTNLTLSGCTFTNNTAGNGACMYSDYRDLEDISPENFVIENCTFENNTTLDYGASGIYFWNNSARISNCTFNGNSSANSAGSLYFGGENDEIIIEDCTFTGGSANFGSAFAHYADFTPLTVNNCTFTGNVTGTSGAVTVGFKADATFFNCTFANNEAQFGAGVFVQNDTTEVTFINCDFTENSASENGGAIVINADVGAVIDGCEFTSNLGGSGGAVAIYGSEGSDLGATIRNNRFIGNTAFTQGGAINIQDTDTNIESNLFVLNSTDGDGYGSAIIMNGASLENSTEVNLVNNTFHFNAGSQGTLSGWTSEDGAELNIGIQNNIFSLSSSADYAIEAGTPELINNGSNLSDNISLVNFLTDLDLSLLEVDPMFIDAVNLDFHLAAGSPAIDAGTDAGAPETDLQGGARVGQTDIGAYEFGTTVGTETPVLNANLLNVAPNPTRALTQLTFDHTYRGEVTVTVVNQLGQTADRYRLQKNADVLRKELNVSKLAAGSYTVLLQFGKEAAAGKLLISE